MFTSLHLHLLSFTHLHIFPSQLHIVLDFSILRLVWAVVKMNETDPVAL